MSTIAENIANIRAQMAEAAKKAGRDPSEILLCAATKMNDAERVKEAVAAGVDCCGENRVQEIQAKRPLGAYTGKPLHFIGHLQTNKVKYLVGVVDLIETGWSCWSASKSRRKSWASCRTFSLRSTSAMRRANPALPRPRPPRLPPEWPIFRTRRSRV